MAWVQIAQSEGMGGVPYSNVGKWYTGDPLRKFRVTIEQEVSECCERWRGKLAVACDKIIAEECHPTIVLGDIHVQSSPPAKFCPECGKKL